MPFRYLDDTTLDDVRTAAMELQFYTDGSLSVLVQEIPPGFVAATLPSGVDQNARLYGFIGQLNRTRVLVTGEVPLHLWLKAAIGLAAGRPQGQVFGRALELASMDGLADPPDAPPTTAPQRPPSDVPKLPRTDAGLEILIGGIDDTLEVGYLHSGAAASRSVARLRVHRYFDGYPSMLPGDQPDRGDGTGWMIAPGLLITNHHVINARSPYEPAASAQDFALQGAAVEAVFDDFGPGAASVSVFPTGCVATDSTLDFALLRLPPDAEPRTPLRLRTSPVLKPAERGLRERINVLQHPGGKPMRLGFRNNFVVTGSAERLSYLTDTAGGASGAPLFDDAWFVAGLHRGFDRIESGPVDVWGQSIGQENYGTPITVILAHLAEHHPDIHAEIVGQQL
jgi:endonuclease G, mitochondrial